MNITYTGNHTVYLFIKVSLAKYRMAHPARMAPGTTSRYSDTREGKSIPPVSEYKTYLSVCFTSHQA